MANPAHSIAWQSDLEELFNAYMHVIQQDMKVANAMGVEYDPGKLEKDRILRPYASEALKMDASSMRMNASWLVLRYRRRLRTRRSARSRVDRLGDGKSGF
jgi:hypothetical protein